ncbi:MAG: hypothetical protein KJ999_21190 [Gammaproteobacteria bacterium]|nr:hypothetical protein [Gammaproteobacteria bacterium]
MSPGTSSACTIWPAFAERDNLDIVISSTWRHNVGLRALKARFPEELARRIIAVTPAYAALWDLPHKVMPFEREAECLDRGRRLTLLYRPFCSELFLGLSQDRPGCSNR